MQVEQVCVADATAKIAEVEIDIALHLIMK